MSKAVDDILGFIRSEDLGPDAQAELIQRLRDGEGDEHKPAGQWIASRHPASPAGVRFSAEEAGFNVEWIHGPDFDDDGLTVTFYHGQMDGKPVVQIDGEADFRINVNDCPIWDQSTGEPYSIPEELEQDMAGKPKDDPREVWVGVIHDHRYGRSFVYAGDTSEALYREMRTEYSGVEYRDESDFEWEKRARDVAEVVVYNINLAEEE